MFYQIPSFLLDVIVGLLGGAVLLGAIALGTSVLAITTRRSLSAAKYRRRVAG